MTDLAPADRGRLADALADDHGVPREALEGWHLRSPADGPEVHATRADPADLPVPAQRVGVRLGIWTDDGFLLTVEGAHLLEDHLDTVHDVEEDRAHPWLAGEDVPAPEDAQGPFVVLRWRGDVIGAGPLRDGTVENRLPRRRRIAEPRWEDDAGDPAHSSK